MRRRDSTNALILESRALVDQLSDTAKSLVEFTIELKKQLDELEDRG